MEAFFCLPPVMLPPSSPIMTISPPKTSCIHVNKGHWSADSHKARPSGAQWSPLIWYRCNYSDNIRRSALAAAGALQWGTFGQCLRIPWNVLYSHPLPATSSKNTCWFIPLLLSIVYKCEFVPVGWYSNEGKPHCYCAAVDCSPPTPSPSHVIDCEPPVQGRCSVCMPPAFPTSIFLPGIPDYCSICLIEVSERLPVCSRCPWRQRVHPKCLRLSPRGDSYKQFISRLFQVARPP